MFDPSMVTAWLLTYLLHSTLFLALAWLAARGPLRRRPALEEAAWRFALVAALVTASVQLAAGREPLAGRWAVTAPAPISHAVSATVAPRASAPLAVHRSALPAPPAGQAVEAAPLPAPPAAQPFPLTAWVAALWAAGACALGARWLAAHLYLRRRLRARPVVVGGDMHAALSRLAGEAGLPGDVRLSCSSRLPVPIALGLRRREICVPPRALAMLSDEQQEGLLAHELGHLVRRDPFWLAFSHLLASILFFQPLNQIARRRLRELSELQSDEWAVGQTGRPLSLARCLAEVAGWSFQPLRSLVVPGMADRPSHLAHRIRRLLDDARSPERRVRPLFLAAGMAVLLIAVAAAAPGVSASAPEKAAVPASAPPPGVGPAGGPTGTGPTGPGPLGEAPRGHGPEGQGPTADAPEAPEAPEAAEAAEADVPDAVDVDIDVAPALADLQDLHLDLDMAPQLAELDAQLATLGDMGKLSDQEMKALEMKMDAMNAQLESNLKPQMEELERRLEKQMSELEKSPAMEQLRARADALARNARPSEAEIEKLSAEAQKLAESGRMTAEERGRLREQARALADQYRMSDKDRAEIRELARKAREESQRFMKEHGAEIEAMRKQIREQAQAMRQQIRQQMEPQLRAMRERHRQEMEKLHKEIHEKMEVHRKEMQKHREEMHKKQHEEREQREKEKHDSVKPESDHAAALPGMALREAVLQGVLGGVTGGVAGGVRGGIPGGIPGGVRGGIPGGIPGGVVASVRGVVRGAVVATPR